MKKVLKKAGALLLIALITVASALPIGAETVTLNWSPVADATSYNVYVRPFGQGAVYVLAANVTSPTFVTNITATGRYEFQVKSKNLGGESIPSSTFVTPAAPPPPSDLTGSVSP